MYYYIVDPQKISQKEFERVQNLLYSSLSEYRVSGEVVRVTGLRTVNQLTENAFAHGVKTLVAVGNDDTLHDVINAVKGRDVVVGFIPIFETEIGEILGVKNIEQASKTIGTRRVEEMDLGRVNGNYFLSKLTFGLTPASTTMFKSLNYKTLQSLFNLPKFEIKFSANAKYQASFEAVAGMIINSRGEDSKFSSPTDGVAEVLLLPKLNRAQTFRYRSEILSGNYEKIPETSIVHITTLEISQPDGLALKVGPRIIVRTPATIEILPKALKIIVGKDRKF
jgi:diacylglycerol kinase family enzyme